MLAVGTTLQTIGFIIFRKHGQAMDPASFRTHQPQVERKLKAAHEVGLRHRDIALRNMVLLGEDVRIIDWGHSILNFTDAGAKEDLADLALVI